MSPACFFSQIQSNFIYKTLLKAKAVDKTLKYIKDKTRTRNLHLKIFVQKTKNTQKTTAMQSKGNISN